MQVRTKSSDVLAAIFLRGVSFLVLVSEFFFLSFLSHSCYSFGEEGVHTEELDSELGKPSSLWLLHGLSRMVLSPVNCLTSQFL